ncbi:TetR/AcrR family transcriptional regulator [Streptomyces sp. ICBB 8177]|uniref:TetR/AcrR family transcriptional regulator n=1 Tax=Streptomyces sp. ICBB 8177 TaxID=563922 RepID=UPI000D67A027|nr:TetR/AcrR family transcriptional regulator [Streptomyces sp. ICBB 8177]PWI42984.1 TetR family transcriptional regulator [Streptomyces sp. ICBB 8177]
MNELVGDPQPVVLPGTRTGREPDRSIRRGPRSTTPEAVAANQRDRLFDGLVRTVADKGYPHARVSDICRAAGVTRPVFYDLFAGKEDAFLAAYRHGTDLLLATMGTAFAGTAHWPSAVRDTMGAMLALLADAPRFAVAAIVEIDALGAAGRQARKRLVARLHRFFTPAPGLPAGVPVEQVVTGVIGGAYSALYREVDEGRAQQLPQLLPTMCYLVLAPFLGPQAAADEAEKALSTRCAALSCANAARRAEPGEPVNIPSSQVG